EGGFVELAQPRAGRLQHRRARRNQEAQRKLHWIDVELVFFDKGEQRGEVFETRPWRVRKKRRPRLDARLADQAHRQRGVRRGVSLAQRSQHLLAQRFDRGGDEETPLELRQQRAVL